MPSPGLQTLLSSARDSLRRLRSLFARNAAWLSFFVFALLVSFAFTTTTPIRTPPARPEAHGDGIYYYAYLRSIAFDRDVDFRNDYLLLGDQFHAGINPLTKLPQNVFTVGPALFWLPLVPVAKAAQHLSEWLGAPRQEPDGSEPTFQRIVLYGSTLAGLVASALILLLALRITDPSLAVFASIGLCLGSPLIWFMLKQPSFSHATDACAVALFAAAWLLSFGVRSLWRWLGLGLLLGLAMMVRPQNIAHVLLPLAEWLLVAVALVRARDSRALLAWVGKGTAFVLMLALAFSPLLLIWRRIYGVWTLVPQGETFMHWHDSRWDVTLFSSRSGLFAWHPLILLSVVGLFVLACSRRYARELRLFAALAIVILFMQSYINGAAHDWWGGWAFGGRRFLSCTLYFGVGLAVVLESFRRFVVARPMRFAQLSAATVLLVAALYNRSLADDYLFGRVAPEQPQPMKPAYASFLNKTLNEGYALFGNPGSWPANLWFAARAHTSPENYDVAAPSDLNDYPPGAVIFPDEAHAMGGFDSTGTQCGAVSCRLAREGHATWVFALRRRVGIHGLIAVAGSHPNTRLRMSIDGHRVLDAKITTEFADYEFVLPVERASAGLHYVDVEQVLPNKDAFVAWHKAFLAFDNPRPED
ncbi:MAG: hypothetical protein JWN48_4584 [Myxococcaceae bacterium]|nr:hypothetical protein [Myxococcaceae bacterium]